MLSKFSTPRSLDNPPMTDTERPLLQRLRLRIDTPRTRQWAAWLLGLWLGFALLAFFVLPPLAKSMLSQQLGQMLQREVSIASVSQRNRRSDADATVVVFTHAAREADVKAAIAWIDALKSTRAPTQLIRIEEGPDLRV